MKQKLNEVARRAQGVVNTSGKSDVQQLGRLVTELSLLVREQQKQIDDLIQKNKILESDVKHVKKNRQKSNVED